MLVLVPSVIRYVSLGVAIEGGLAVTVFLFACGSSSLVDATRIGHTTRWVALFALCALAVAAAFRTVRRTGIPWRAIRIAWLPAAFIGIAVLSAGWSARPRLSFERAASFGVLLALAFALAIASRVDLGLRRRVFAGLALGSSLIGIAGVLMAIAGMHEARQPAAGFMPGRFEGFGQNPNTIALLDAVALPLIAWLAVTTSSRRARLGWAASFLVLYGSTVASQSRGGLIGAFLGSTLVLALVIRPLQYKVLAISAVAALTVFGVVLRQSSTQTPPPFVSAVQPGIPKAVTGSGGGGKGKGKGKGSTAGAKIQPKIVAAQLPARNQEIGDPRLSTHGVTLIGSGRVAAWLGALKLIQDRPLLGYGFGTEEIVFVDRWYYFDGARPENSLLGILLQVGVIGLLPLLTFLVMLVGAGVRALRSADAAVRSFAVAPLGVLVAALVLVFFQSYVYSVGDVATVTVWVALFALGVGVTERGSTVASS
jgi:O-antigen ligase